MDFLNRDTISEQGGLNLYAYCGNNGVNRWDLLGNISQDFYHHNRVSEANFDHEGSPMDFDGLAAFLNNLPAHYVSAFKERQDREALQAAVGRDLAKLTAGLKSGEPATVTDATGKTYQINPGDKYTFGADGLDSLISITSAGPIGQNNNDVGGLFGRGTPTTATANSTGLGITRTLSESDPNTHRTAALYDFSVPAGSNGVIVQMNVNSNSLLDSAGNPANPLSPIGTRTYWEGWNVVNGAVVPVGSQRTGPNSFVPYNDMFNIPGWSNAVAGTFVKTGTVVFFPNATMSRNFPELVPGGVGAAGRLNSSYTQPRNWVVDSGAQTHQITINPSGNPPVAFQP